MRSPLLSAANCTMRAAIAPQQTIVDGDAQGITMPAMATAGPASEIHCMAS